MKAVAVALVLIAGAAVVLWYGNTLNSWVLGGLIGGLAALLLSLPISLSLFSYLSKRHDERIHAEEALIEAEHLRTQREEARLRTYEQRYIESIESSLYDAVEDEREAYELDRLRRQQLAARKRMLEEEERLFLQRENMRALPAPRTRELYRREDRPKRGQYPGLPGTTGNLARGKHQSEALRTARLEASQQEDEQGYQAPRRRYGAVKNRREEREEEGKSKRSRRTRDLALDEAKDDARFSETSEEGKPTRQRKGKEVGPTYAGQHFVETEPIPPPEKSSRQATRHPHIDPEYLHPAEGDLGNASHTRPLIRKAPYLYEDDLLRQELTQHFEHPSVKRSSRNERSEELDEEEL